MAGLAAAWRLSEPGWRRRFSSITVLERSFRLGGKGASGRGVHGRDRGARPARLARPLRQRVPAHPRLLRRARPRTGPTPAARSAPGATRSSRPSELGLFDRARTGGRRGWPRSPATGSLPGEPGADGGHLGGRAARLRSALLLRDFYASLDFGRAAAPGASAVHVTRRRPGRPRHVGVRRDWPRRCSPSSHAAAAAGRPGRAPARRSRRRPTPSTRPSRPLLARLRPRCAPTSARAGCTTSSTWSAAC